MGDPLLHRAHGYAVDILPVVDLMIGEIFIVDEGALEREEVGKDDSAFGEEEVSGFDDAIQQPIEVKTVAHGFSQDNVYFCVELPPTEDLDHSFQVIFLNDFSHHVCALHFGIAISIEDCVDLATASLCCKDGVQAIDSISDVEDCLAGEEMLILRDGLVVGLVGELVLHCCLEGVQGEVVDFAQMLGILQVQQSGPNFYWIFLGELILLSLFFPGLGRRVLLHFANQQLWRNVNVRLGYRFQQIVDEKDG